uniref:Uncharacterized protein n=1 Tax=Parastrongyloides trichosuri TaxID=131310 RepID=A0A0N4Z190_PARTI
MCCFETEGLFAPFIWRNRLGNVWGKRNSFMTSEKENINNEIVYLPYYDNDSEIQEVGDNNNKHGKFFKKIKDSLGKRKSDDKEYESFIPVAKPSWGGLGGVWGKRSDNKDSEIRKNLMFEKLFG